MPVHLVLLLTLLVFENGCSLYWWHKTKPLIPPTPPPQALVVQQQFQAVLARDDQAMRQICQWLDESREVRRKDPSFAIELGQQIHRRLDTVRIAYEKFLKRHPDHNGARSAFASFLTCMRDEQGALTQWNRALLNDDNNAAFLESIPKLDELTSLQEMAYDHISIR